MKRKEQIETSEEKRDRLWKYFNKTLAAANKQEASPVVVKAFRAARGGKVPAIALTAYARTEDRVRALVAGFQVHLPKPIEPVELVAVVASLVGRTGTA
jgi:CheY-like chemotaxis protein